jgi:hypothetical protein
MIAIDTLLINCATRVGNFKSALLGSFQSALTAASSGVFVDFSGGDVGVISTVAVTTGFLADAGLALDFYTAGNGGLSDVSNTAKTCVFIVCVSVHVDPDGNFAGAGAGLYLGTESALGGGFSYHENYSMRRSWFNLSEIFQKVLGGGQREGRCE